MKTVQIEIPEGKELRWINNVLTLVNERPEPKTIMDQIKTFDDALVWCKNNGRADLADTYCNCVTHLGSLDALSYMRIRIITCALNEGWVPTVNWGDTYWQVYIVKADDLDLKKQIIKYGEKIAAIPHVGYLDVIKTNWCFYGSYMLGFKSEELARYALKQFYGLYTEFFFNIHVNNEYNDYCE